MHQTTSQKPLQTFADKLHVYIGAMTSPITYSCKCTPTTHPTPTAAMLPAAPPSVMRPEGERDESK